MDHEEEPSFEDLHVEAQKSGALSPVGFTEEIVYEEIKFGKVVGRGAFGEVQKAIWRNHLVAVKTIQGEAEAKALKDEVQQLSTVSHPNIIRLYGTCSRKPKVCLVMEYAEGGSLYDILHPSDHVKHQSTYTFGHVMSWALQCALAMEYLHGLKPRAIIHRDLKPPNMLLTKCGTVLKLCDFGTACYQRTNMTSNRGSAAWMAPEVFEGKVYDAKCDVYSFGIVLWEMITRKKPFEDIGPPAFRIMWAVHSGIRPPLIRGIPTSIEQLIVHCWHQNTQYRPSFTHIVKFLEKASLYVTGGDIPLTTPKNSVGDALTLSSDGYDSSYVSDPFARSEALTSISHGEEKPHVDKTPGLKADINGISEEKPGLEQGALPDDSSEKDDLSNGNLEATVLNKASSKVHVLDQSEYSMSKDKLPKDVPDTLDNSNIDSSSKFRPEESIGTINEGQRVIDSKTIVAQTPEQLYPQFNKVHHGTIKPEHVGMYPTPEPQTPVAVMKSPDPLNAHKYSTMSSDDGRAERSSRPGSSDLDLSPVYQNLNDMNTFRKRSKEHDASGLYWNEDSQSPGLQRLQSQVSEVFHSEDKAPGELQTRKRSNSNLSLSDQERGKGHENSPDDYRSRISPIHTPAETTSISPTAVSNTVNYPYSSPYVTARQTDPTVNPYESGLIQNLLGHVNTYTSQYGNQSAPFTAVATAAPTLRGNLSDESNLGSIMPQRSRTPSPRLYHQDNSTKSPFLTDDISHQQAAVETDNIKDALERLNINATIPQPKTAWSPSTSQYTPPTMTPDIVNTNAISYLENNILSGATSGTDSKTSPYRPNLTGENFPYSQIREPDLNTGQLHQGFQLRPPVPIERSRSHPSSSVNLPSMLKSHRSESDNRSLWHLLEPEFVPVKPIENNGESINIYKQHRELVSHYLRLKEDREYLLQRKRDLEQRINEEQKEQQRNSMYLEDYLKLQEEKQSLSLFLESIHFQLKRTIKAKINGENIL